MTVTWLDRELAIRCAQAVADELAAEHPEVEGILLFGSVARGDAVPGSDIDLLLVLRETALPFVDRGARYAATAALGVEVLAYTAAELADLLACGNPLIRRAIAEGRWLVGPPRCAGLPAAAEPA